MKNTIKQQEQTEEDYKSYLTLEEEYVKGVKKKIRNKGYPYKKGGKSPSRTIKQEGEKNGS